jgi:hypothetical protein
MIARSAKTAAVTLLSVMLLGMSLPQAAQARDYGRDSHSYSRQYSDHRGRDYRDDGRRYDHPRHHGRGHGNHYYRNGYAPRYYYPDVVVYPVAPRAYYPAPYYAPYGGGYPSEYGTVGIHLDYNWLF